MRPLVFSALSAVSLLALGGCDLLSSTDDAQEHILGEERTLAAAEAMLNAKERTPDDSGDEASSDRETGKNDSESEDEGKAEATD